MHCIYNKKNQKLSKIKTYKNKFIKIYYKVNKYYINKYLNK